MSNYYLQYMYGTNLPTMHIIRCIYTNKIIEQHENLQIARKRMLELEDRHRQKPRYAVRGFTTGHGQKLYEVCNVKSGGQHGHFKKEADAQQYANFLNAQLELEL